MKTIKDRNYSFNHVTKRLKERYDLDITMDEYNILNLVTILDIPKFIEHQKGDTQFIYDIMFKKKMIRVVYSDKRNLITTVLPEGV